MATLIVDFNMAEADGRIPALITPAQARTLAVGEKVLAADGEGTECVAVVTDIATSGRYAVLAPVGGSWRRDSEIRPSAHDLLAGQQR
jgi:hypothetical protein